MLLDELPGLLLQRVALHMPNPSPLAGAFRAAWNEARSDQFTLKWFHKWHGVHVPHRPWQYAAITWQRLHGSQSAPEQLAAFLLRYMQHRTKQRSQRKEMTSLHSSESQELAIPAATAATATAAPQQQSPPTALFLDQQQDHAVAAGNQPHPEAVEPPLTTSAAAAAAAAAGHLIKDQPFEGSCSLFPACQPSLTSARKASKLLARGSGLDALLLLCPMSGALLLAYAAQARNRQLIEQIITSIWAHDEEALVVGLFPRNFMAYSSCFALIPTVEVACYTALKQRWPDMLALLLATKGGACTYIGRPLLRYAVRHSNAECLQQVLVYTAATFDLHSRIKPAPEHLAVAAARTDPWAAGVVELLLKVLPAQQRTAKWLRPVYKAAAASGNADVMQLMMQQAAAAPEQHLPVLLQVCGAAAAAAGVWQQLLGLQPQTDWSSCGSSSSQQGQQQQQQQQQHQHQQCIASSFQSNLQGISDLQWVAILLHVLLHVTRRHDNSMPQQQQQQQQEIATKLAMADQLWQLLQQLGLVAAVRQTMASTVGDTFEYCFKKTGMYGYMLPEVFNWLQRRQLLPVLKRNLLQDVMQKWVVRALKAGQLQKALQMHQMLRHAQVAAAAVKTRTGSSSGSGGSGSGSKPRAAAVLTHVWSNRVTVACAAADVAALQQLLAFKNLYSVLNRWGSFHEPFPSHGLFSPFSDDNELVALKQQQQWRQRPANCSYPVLVDELGVSWPLLQRLMHQCWAAAAKQSSECDIVSDDEVSNAMASTERAVITSLQQQQQQQQQRGPLPLWQQCMLEVASHSSIGMEPAHCACSRQMRASALATTAALQHRFLATGQQLQCTSAAAAVPRLLATQHLGQGDHRQAQLRPLELVKQVLCSPVVKDAPLVKDYNLFGQAVVQAAVEELQPELLEWSLKFPQRRWLFEPEPETYLCAVGETTTLDMCPITNASSRARKIQRQLELQQLQQHKIGLCQIRKPTEQIGAGAAAATTAATASTGLPKSSTEGATEAAAAAAAAWARSRGGPTAAAAAAGAGAATAGAFSCFSLQPGDLGSPVAVPDFVQRATGVSLLLLHLQPNKEDLLSNWISNCVRPSSSETDLLRTKSVLAAVAAAEELPAGAKVMRRKALRQVLAAGDVDLLAMLLMWAGRLKCTVLPGWPPGPG